MNDSKEFLSRRWESRGFQAAEGEWEFLRPTRTSWDGTLPYMVTGVQDMSHHSAPVVIEFLRQFPDADYLTPDKACVIANNEGWDMIRAKFAPTRENTHVVKDESLATRLRDAALNS